MLMCVISPAVLYLSFRDLVAFFYEYDVMCLGVWLAWVSVVFKFLWMWGVVVCGMGG